MSTIGVRWPLSVAPTRLHAHLDDTDGGLLTAASIPSAILGVTGTPNATTVLFGDRRWAAVTQGDVTGLVAALAGKSAVGHSHAFSEITAKPTTLAGYGITDGALSGHTHAFSELTSKPTTLAGYGITDLDVVGDVQVSGFVAVGTIPSTTGAIRLPNAGAISARNSADTINVTLLSLTAANNLGIGSTGVAAVQLGNTSGTVQLSGSLWWPATHNTHSLGATGTRWKDLFLSGVVDVTTSVKVAGTKVLGAQGAAVIDATDAASAITQLNALLARCRAHGLIA